MSNYKLDASNGFHIYGWMVTDLHLEGGDLLAFALVHQFAQSRAGIYKGNTAYLSAWTGWTEKTSRSHLSHLVELGLIREFRGRENNTPYCYYELTEDFYEKHPVKITASLGKNFQEHSVKISEGAGKKLPGEYNIEEKNIEKNIDISVFDYRKSVIDLGVPEPLADAFMKVRKTKKAVDSEIAFNGLKNQIEKSGLTPQACIEMCVVNSWKGFRADWLEHRKGPYQMPNAQNRKNTQFVD